MKITTSRVDDVRRQQEEYEKTYQEQQARYTEQYTNYRNAVSGAQQPIVDKINEVMSRYPALQYEVRVQGEFDRISVDIDVNERRKFDENVALAWGYKAVMNKDGEVTRETSSWSGMQAVTEEQIDSLQQTVDALRALQRIDWKQLLNITSPKYGDYVTEEYPGHKKSFDSEMKVAEIQDLIGTRTAVCYEGYYYLVINETDKFFGVLLLGWDPKEFDLETLEEKIKEGTRSVYYKRIKKESFVSNIKYPLITAEV